MAEPITIFLSYAHEDRELLEDLKSHLSPLERSGLISVWDDQQILPGAERKAAIDKNLNTANIIILFISDDFFESEYLYNFEMQRALERYAANDATVIPLIVRPCMWSLAPISKLNILPTDGKAITSWANYDEAWLDVIKGIKEVTKSLQQTKVEHEQAVSFRSLQPFYRELCERGRTAMQNMTVEITPYLDDFCHDKRIGLTLIGRPSKIIKTRLEAVLSRMNEVAPAHFYYDAPRFHFTILSLIDADDPPRSSREIAQKFIKPIREVLAVSQSFEVEFYGICATPNSFIVRGFPIGDGLTQIRDLLRERLNAEGLGAELDKRYKIQGAHITLGRFRVQEDFTRLIALLDELCEEPIGRMRVQQGHLVLNDFYMSPDKVQVVDVIQIDTPKVNHNLPIKGEIIGRTSEHQKLLDMLWETDKPLILVSGFGGIGKSTLARMAAWTCVERRIPFRQITWVDVRQYGRGTTPSLNGILDTIGNVIDPSGAIPLISNLDIKQKQVRDKLASCPTLLIVDNYESLLANLEEEHRISEFLNTLPIESTELRVLITTREISGKLRQFPIEDMPLERLSLDESIRFMKSRATSKHNLTDKQYARIWEIWFGLPKYMEIAMEQLTTIPFTVWEQRYTTLRHQSRPNDRFFSDIMSPAWQRFSEQFRHVLMAVTLFVGEASYKALEAVSGLADMFFEVMTSDPAISGAYIEQTKSGGYRVHSLIQAYCQGHLNSEVYAEFRRSARLCFVNYYVDLATTEHEAEYVDVLAKEIANIVEAAKTAIELKVWDKLLLLSEAISTFLRFRGYWQERIVMTNLAIEACRQLGKQDLLARYLGDDLTWLYLRLEKLDDAERAVKEGLQLYTDLVNPGGIAQATRHLGKAALLKGLDEYYVPNDTWPHHFPDAECYYQESLNIQRRLQDEGHDRRLQLADMYLDFGRLYWLDGQYLWKIGCAQNDHAQIERGLARLEESNDFSRQAMDIFKALGDERGIAKAWGNLGNSTKEISKLWIWQQNWEKATKYVFEAKQQYQTSYDISRAIQRQDEVSHALWGLAEILKLCTSYPDLREDSDDVNQLLKQALDYALQAHEIYTALGGEKDFNATQRLVEQLTEIQKAII